MNWHNVAILWLDVAVFLLLVITLSRKKASDLDKVDITIGRICIVVVLILGTLLVGDVL